jgi:hypothetical protein
VSLTKYKLLFSKGFLVNGRHLAFLPTFVEAWYTCRFPSCRNASKPWRLCQTVAFGSQQFPPLSQCQWLFAVVGSGESEDITHESTVSPISCKGTGGFTSHGLLGMSQNATRQINRRHSCTCCCRDMLKDHSPLTPNTHPQQKGLN